MKKKTKITIFYIVFFGLSFLGLGLYFSWMQSGNDKYYPTQTVVASMAIRARAVCNGGSIPEAAAYDGSSGKIHPGVMIVDRLESTPSDWLPSSISGLQLVACVQLAAVDKTPYKTCNYKFENNPNGPKTFTMDVYGQGGSVSIYSAKDGKLIHKTISVTTTTCDCPVIVEQSKFESTKVCPMDYKELVQEYIY
jgi:hypothetical protein